MNFYISPKPILPYEILFVRYYLWAIGIESSMEQVLDSAKTLSGWFSRYLTYILVVTSGGRDGYPVQNSTNNNNNSNNNNKNYDKNIYIYIYIYIYIFKKYSLQ